MIKQSNNEEEYTGSATGTLCFRKHDDLRIKSFSPLKTPQNLIDSIPLTSSRREVVKNGRLECENIIKGLDDRLLVVVGPCSIHDVTAAIDYAQRLKEYADSSRDELCIVMRTYFEKPRSTVGWKGLINDPDMDETNDVSKGLKISRSLLAEIADLGLPTSCEFLSPLTCQYIVDLVSWGSIGARTIESAPHREMVSGLSVPIGCKNSTTGDVKMAFDAILSARISHSYISVTKEGRMSVICTYGNECCHVILRGRSSGTNYSESSVNTAVKLAHKVGVNPRLMIDCSHGNSGKDFRKQKDVVKEICRQLTSSGTSEYILGVMIESNINEGSQDPGVLMNNTDKKLEYGVSITDSCISWEETVNLLECLRKAVRARRAKKIFPESKVLKSSSDIFKSFKN